MQDIQQGGTKFKADFAGGSFYKLLMPGAVLHLLWKMQKITTFKNPLQMFLIVKKQSTTNFTFRNNKVKVFKLVPTFLL